MNTKEEFTDTPSAPAGDNTGLVPGEYNRITIIAHESTLLSSQSRLKSESGFPHSHASFFGYSHIVPSTFPLDQHSQAVNDMLMRGILCDKQLSSVKPTYEEATGEEILCKTKKVKKEKEFFQSH